MTDVRQRVDPPGAEMRPSVVLHGGLTAVAAALSGLAVLAAIVLVAWVADAGPGSGGGDAVRAAADAWLLAHGGGLSTPAGHVRGIPLGLTLLAAVVLHRAGASLARAVAVTDLRAAARATTALAVPYALLAAAVARLAATDAAAASAVRAGTGALLLAGLAGGRGVLRAADLLPAVRRRLPGWLPAVTRAALAAVAGLLGSGLALLLVALVWHGGRFAELTGALRPGLVGGVVLMLGCLLLVPNGALWTVAYAAGPGFSVGAGTGVSPFGATLGPVPAFPLLAALPGDGTPSPAVRAVLLLPVLAGVLAGWQLSRRLPAGGGPARLPAALSGRAARSGICGLIAGGAGAVATAVLAALAGGAFGPGYLSAVGPSAGRVALALLVEVGVPAALTAAVLPGRAATARTPGRAGATRAPVAPRSGRTGSTRVGSARADSLRPPKPGSPVREKPTGPPIRKPAAQPPAQPAEESARWPTGQPVTDAAEGPAEQALKPVAPPEPTDPAADAG